MSASPKKLKRSFYIRDPQTVAVELLNKVLVVGGRSGRVVEVEAYGGADDPASHAFKGETLRNSMMFRKGGLLYVYFTYGMHFCANAVTGKEGEPSAVLIRALEPLTGKSEMRLARGLPENSLEKHLTSGPAKLCQALGIDRNLNGTDLISGEKGIFFLDDGINPPANPLNTPRIGIRSGTEHLWRWSLH